MLTSKRDYIQRIVEEVAEFLARVIFPAESKGRREDAMQSVVQAGKDQLFQFTPEQQFIMLTEHETPEIAGQKVLALRRAQCRGRENLYDAGQSGKMARSCLINALRFTLMAQASFPSENPPAYAPRVPHLLDALKDAPLDADTDTAALLRAERPTPND